MTRGLWRRARTLLARARFERDMREELRAHIDHRADDLVANGLPRDEALHRARVEFGAMEAYKEQCRDAGGLAPSRPLLGLSGDLKLGIRRLLAAPLFTVFAVLSLGTGVGVTTVAYSVVDRVFWGWISVPNPGRVALMFSAEIGPYDPRFVASSEDFHALRRQQTSFAELSAARPIYPAVETIGRTELMPAYAVDEAYFAAVGIHAATGRTIGPHDVQSRAPVVVISDWLWRARFAGARDLVGRTVRLGGQPFEVVGILPRDFEGERPGRPVRLWVPITTADSIVRSRPSSLPERDRRRLTVIGRLRDGVDARAASAEVNAVAERLDAAYPRQVRSESGVLVRRGWTVKTIEEADRDGTLMTRFGLVVIALVGLVLVVACTNLANLVLARGARRHHELAVRTALGATRWRLVREQLVETLLIAIAGGGCAIVVFILISGLMDIDVPFGRSMRVWIQPTLDGPALVATVVAVLLSLIVFGLEPALSVARRTDVRNELVQGSGSAGVPQGRRHRSLLRWQTAISVGFFIISLMCVRYLATQARHDSGVALDRIGVAILNFYAQGWDETRARAAIERLDAALRSAPGVEAAAVSVGLPFGTTMTPWVTLSTPDKPIDADTRGGAVLVPATPGYFRAVGTPILKGRSFDGRDSTAARRVIVLSEGGARQLFGTSDAVGRELLMRVDTSGYRREEPVQRALVVGIAADTDAGHMFRRDSGVAYVPLAQEYLPTVTVIARGSTGRTALAAALSTIRATDPAIGVERSGPALAMVSGPYVTLRIAGALGLGLGGVTLLLAMTGLYGAQSQIVSHRTRELGVRMTLGATTAQIRAVVLKDGCRPVLQGLLLGLFFGFVGRGLARALLWPQIGFVDPWMVLGAPVPVLLAAFFACYLPARRASRVDPNVALRHL